MASPNVSDIIASTLENRSSEVADNVTDNNAILAQMKRKGRIKTYDGGRIIYWNLSYTENPNGGSFSGYDLLPVNAAEVLSAAEYSPKQYAVPVVVSGAELLANSSRSQVFDLIAERIDVAKSTMANLIAQGMYSDGTGNGGKDITGLGAAVVASPATGTYGGIDRATWAFWRNQTHDPTSTPTTSTIQGEMNTLWAKCVRGTDAPDLILAGSTVWATYMGSLQPQQRFTDSDLAKLGFTTVKYMSADVVLDGGIGGNQSATVMHFLNTKYLKWQPHEKRNFVPLDPQKRSPVNQDAHVQILGFHGNMTCGGAQFQGYAKFD